MADYAQSFFEKKNQIAISIGNKIGSVNLEIKPQKLWC